MRVGYNVWSMGVIEAIILGLIQGLTEFIPVSSSGHLLLAQQVLNGEVDHLFIQALDFGTALALVIYFWSRLMNLFERVTKHRDFRLARNILLTSIPAGMLGLLLADFIQTSPVILSPYLTISMLALVGAIMIATDYLPKRSEQETGTELSPKRALFIGVAQSFALIPGVSRSGSTIVASRLMGLNAKAAAEYSFMVSIPIMLGLLAKLLIKPSDRAYLAANLDMVIIANIAAFGAAMIAIHFMLKYLARHGLRAFGFYRIGLATVALVFLLLQ